MNYCADSRRLRAAFPARNKFRITTLKCTITASRNYETISKAPFAPSRSFAPPRGGTRSPSFVRSPSPSRSPLGTPRGPFVQAAFNILHIDWLLNIHSDINIPSSKTFNCPQTQPVRFYLFFTTVSPSSRACLRSSSFCTFHYPLCR